MTRAELTQNIESLFERLYVHDELTAAALEADYDAHKLTLGMNGLKLLCATLEELLAPYEVV